MLQAAKETAEQLRAEFQRGLEMGARLGRGDCCLPRPTLGEGGEAALDGDGR